MKEYPLTSRELWMLGGLQLGSAASFAMGGSCLGLWLNQRMAAGLASGVELEALGYWNGIGTAALFAAIALGIVGLGLFGISGWTVAGIISETTHAKDK
jgi:hypothetical protein